MLDCVRKNKAHSYLSPYDVDWRNYLHRYPSILEGNADRYFWYRSLGTCEYDGGPWYRAYAVLGYYISAKHIHDWFVSHL